MDKKTKAIMTDEIGAESFDRYKAYIASLAEADAKPKNAFPPKNDCPYYGEYPTDKTIKPNKRKKK